jgi:hypothetical protein
MAYDIEIHSSADKADLDERQGAMHVIE